MNKIKNWYEDKEFGPKTIKKLWLAVLILFVVGLIFKLIDASMATWNWNRLVNNRGDFWNQYQALLKNQHASKEAIKQVLGAYIATKKGGADQLVGASIGWGLIGLKLIIYNWSLISIGSHVFKKNAKPISDKELWFTTIKYIVLTFGLFVGEIITIWMTERNDADLTPRVIYSFVSPAISVIFALSLIFYSHAEIKIRKKHTTNKTD